MSSHLDNIKLVVFIFFISFYMLSCKNDSEEELYVNQECNIEAVSFDKDVSSIISNHCSSCHGGTSTSGAAAGLLLVTYDQIRFAATHLTEDGIIHRITRSEGDPLLMPGSYRIPQCQIDKIIAWVDQGALNN